MILVIDIGITYMDIYIEREFPNLIRQKFVGSSSVGYTNYMYLVFLKPTLSRLCDAYCKVYKCIIH